MEERSQSILHRALAGQWAKTLDIKWERGCWESRGTPAVPALLLLIAQPGLSAAILQQSCSSSTTNHAWKWAASDKQSIRTPSKHKEPGREGNKALVRNYLKKNGSWIEQASCCMKTGLWKHPSREGIGAVSVLGSSLRAPPPAAPAPEAYQPLLPTAGTPCTSPESKARLIFVPLNWDTVPNVAPYNLYLSSCRGMTRLKQSTLYSNTFFSIVF